MSRGIRDDTACTEVPKQISHEQRATICLRVDQRAEILRELMLWKLETKIFCDVGGSQKIESDFAAQSAGLEVELQLREWMLSKQQLRGSKRDEDHHAH